MFKHFTRSQSWLLPCLLCLAFLIPNINALPVQAESLAAPTVVYIPGANTIVIGTQTGVAASEIISLPEVATKLAELGQSSRLADLGGGVWLLKSGILIQQSARLDVTSPAVAELRLESTLTNFIKIVSERGGYLLVDGVKIIAWDTTLNAVDQSLTDGRSYLLAQDGGRIDLLRSEVAYLGWGANEISGVAWRKRSNPADPATGATGIVDGSNIHHNFVGLFAGTAYGLKVLNTQIHSNISLGINVRDDSQQIEIGGNNIYANASHGIILTRQSSGNVIRNNQVHENTQEGIVVEQASNNNTVNDNVIFLNRVGIALSQVTGSVLQNNQVRNNITGIRLDAKYSANSVVDTVTTNNQVIGNTLEDNTEYGIYLYSRADRNTIRSNTVLRSGIAGIYVKSGGNVLQSNTVSAGVVGISILGGESLDLPPGAAQPLDPPGNNNVIISSTITGNNDVGIRIQGGSNNRIGANPQTAPAEANLIQSNGKDGIAINSASNGTVATDNQILGNMIRDNGSRGVYVKDAGSVRNRISQNMITNNASFGILIDGGAQANIQKPVIVEILADGVTNGTAQAGATIEVYSDPSNEGQTFLGTTVVDGSGAWTFQVTLPQNPKQVTALVIDPAGNTSSFGSLGGEVVVSIVGVFPDQNGQNMIQVTGVGAVVNIADVKNGLGSFGDLLQELPPGSGKWLLNANLFIGENVTLNLGGQNGSTELLLRSSNALSATGSVSSSSVTVVHDLESGAVANIDYSTFVYLRTHSGVINMDGIKISSWDPAANNGDGGVDEEVTNGRAFIIAKFGATLNIRNSELSYLGSTDSESSGVTWRDQNDPLSPSVQRSRVTGEVISSVFHHNYYGMFAAQASNMLLRDNQFHSNLRYGITLRDLTHDIQLENNQAFDNGSHGFLISRGCYNLVLRNNKAYSNTDPSASLANGFVLDSGSAAAGQLPSTDNVLENNEAYQNEGYGLRVQGSNGNTIVGNNFYENQQGIYVDAGSSENVIRGNTLAQNSASGIAVRESADGNTIDENTMTGNFEHGLYLRSNNNTATGNLSTGNKKSGIAIILAVGVTAVQDNQLVSNTVTGNTENGIDLRGATRTLIQENLVEGNGLQGVYLTDNASQNMLMRNTLRVNQGYGIRANGLQTLGNTWTSNQVYANVGGGIALVGSANADLPAPKLSNVVERKVTGTARPGATIEIFTDSNTQGHYFEGQTVVGEDGKFTFDLSPRVVWQGSNITAVAIDAAGNASTFSGALVAPLVAPNFFLHLPIINR